MNGSHTRKRAAPPDVQIFLSRPAYPLGGTVVGTVVIQQPPSENGKTDHTSLRSLLESITVYVAGFCKIDARWHDSSSYTKIYGTTHPQLKPLRNKFSSKVLDQNNDTVCFWATNGMEALDLPERSDGRLWKNSETDFQSGLHDDTEAEDTNTNHSGVIEDKGDGEDNDQINRNILAFTFRVDIPEDLPHSVHATTCRYFYAAHVLVKTATEERVLKRDFRVISSTSTPHRSQRERSNQINPTGTRIKLGECFGLAHSNGLPCHLSVTEIHRPTGQLVVVQNHCLVRQYQLNNDVQMLKVSNLSGQPVCMLTIIGSQSLCPGACVRLQWDFPTNETWVPCHQVCACLQGEEFAIYEDESKKRTQSFLFDTCHEWVDPGVTDVVSKTLWLSSSGDGGNNTNHFEAPCDLKTDIMEVSTWCQVDITIGEQSRNGAKEGKSDGYQNLSLRIPCLVNLRNSTNDEQEEHERMEQQVQPLNELLGIGTDTIAFATNDIRSDLKTLSLMMNGLVCGGQSHNDSR